MAMTMSDFKALLAQENIQYFLHPTEPVVMARFRGMQCSYEITIGLQLDGTFMQFRTMNYATCRADSPHLPAVFKHLLDLNLRTRWLKWVWNAQDGEIAATGDMWIMDGGVTRAQFSRMLANLLPSIDLASARMKTIIETGVDPGETDPEELRRRQASPGDPAPKPAPQPVTEI